MISEPKYQELQYQIDLLTTRTREIPLLQAELAKLQKDNEALKYQTEVLKNQIADLRGKHTALISQVKVIR